MIRSFCNLVLKGFTFVFPVFIAACYGVSYFPDGDEENTDTNDPSRSYKGRVRSQKTAQPVEDIKVSCLGANLELLASTYTMAGDAAFHIAVPPKVTCARLQFDDLDSAENGGEFLSHTLMNPTANADLVVDLILGTPGDTDTATEGPDAGLDASAPPCEK